MDTLNGTDSGRFLVVTSSESRYLIDLDDSTMRRFPAMDMAVDRALRRDGQSVEVVALKECTVGRPMVLLINLRVPGVLLTTRPTTDVRSIERMPEGADELRSLLGRLPGAE
jgi:hypothetical protein